MAKSILVTYSERNKVFIIPEDRNDLEYIANRFYEEFQVDSCISITFKQYEADWDAYVKLDSQSELQHKDRIKVIASQPQLVTIDLCVKLILRLHNKRERLSHSNGVTSPLLFCIPN